TFLTLVSALRAVQTGSVRVAGQELRGATDAVLTTARRQIGFVFQKHNLISALTARQNVQMAMLIDRPADSVALADALLARVGLRGHEHKRPRELSGGQQQRVAIARALARQPRVIMADEPTASLDAQTGHEIIGFIQSLARTEGCAVMIVTHDSRILDVADRILTLDDGRMIETDANFERLADELAVLFAGLPQVFAYFPEDGPPRLAEYQAQRQQFAAATEALNMRASDHVRLKLKPEAAHRADALQQMLAAIRSLEVLLGEFAGHLRDSPRDLQRGTGHALQQALETVLLTAADALRTRDPDDIDILARIASDRSEAMKRLRDSPSIRPGATTESDELRRNALFALTNDFARLIYLHGQVAHFLTEMRRR
ncbi:MAG TPA: ATP-binding cassette domain-containing protein, partial [Opitutaceae bacterium]|nr:ATP-binding cassette domain-containing protein [Opitutaceae bacterium]